eukprot:392434-Rhodomonas_salina.1
MSKLQVAESTSVTEEWCENPLTSMLREGFNLPQQYLSPELRVQGRIRLHGNLFLTNVVAIWAVWSHLDRK